MEGAGLVVLLLFGGSFVLIIAIILLIASLFFIFSRREDRLQRTRHVCRAAVRRTLPTVAVIVAVGCAWSYWSDARERSAITAADCYSEQSPDNLYLARICYVGRTKRVLRVYDRDQQHLFAERTYRDTSGVLVHLYWQNGVLRYYAEDDYPHAINLPPSIYDRLLAKLP